MSHIQAVSLDIISYKKCRHLVSESEGYSAYGSS